MLSREEIISRIQQLPAGQQARAAELALQLLGPASTLSAAHRTFSTQYQFDSQGYIEDVLGWTPWSGTDTAPGQVEVLEAYNLALRQQHERDDFEAGVLELDELTVWKPGDVICNWIRCEAGHTVGKTKLSDGIVNHFLDCFIPSIIYTFAPSWVQIHDLLWKEIKADRGAARWKGKPLPGKINDLDVTVSANHFAKGRATNNAGGNGTERVQGQHGKYLLFVIDEAEGVPKFIYDAIKSMASGGIVIVLMLANPRTRTSSFHKAKNLPYVRSFRISCMAHPNVLAGREIVPGAVRRGYVEGMLEGDGEEPNVKIVPVHNADKHTFTLPFDVVVQGQHHAAGTIFEPNGEFLFRVMGIPGENGLGNTFCPPGRYEAACKRDPDDATRRHDSAIRIGGDIARWGVDLGTLYCCHKGSVWRFAQLAQESTTEYVRQIREEAMRLWNEAPADQKPLSLHIRLDGSGGFAGGIIDKLRECRELTQTFEDFQAIEVPFGANASDIEKYDNIVTEMYAEAAESIKGLAILKAPGMLETDLCERPFKWVNVSDRDIKRLVDKDRFRMEHGRSPDDGDGFVLAVSPDRIFKHLDKREAAVGKAFKFER